MTDFACSGRPQSLTRKNANANANADARARMEGRGKEGGRGGERWISANANARRAVTVRVVR